ncbi:putative SOS response-associated peptidase YedK [compost metagenome]
MPNALVNHTGDQPFERYNAAPSTHLVISHQEGQHLHADMARWGMASTLGEGPRRSDQRPGTESRHGSFFRAIWSHRAIIAINNWFEWVNEGRPKKQPYLIRRRARAPILCAAIGQYPNAEHPSGEHDGFVIITADSAGGMVDTHDRRPVILSPELAREWLDPATPKDRAELMVLQKGEPTEAFEWFKVDRAIGNVRNQERDMLMPKED